MADPTDAPDLSYIIEPLRPLAVLIDSVALDPSNAMDHPSENLEAIRGSLAKYGQRKPVVVNRNGNVIEAGNGTWVAAKALGWEYLAAVFVDDDPHTATGYAIADNRTAQLAGWFYERLVAQLQTFDEPAAEVPGVSEEFLAEVMAEAGGGEEPAADPGAQIDRAAELQEKWGVKISDLWEIGEHRLVCGDCTDALLVEAVMRGERADAVVTDPPYGIGLDTDYTRFTSGFDVQRTTHAPVIGDDRPFDPRPFLDYDTVVLWGANFYAQHLPVGSWLIWDKRFKNGEAFLSDAELAWMKGGYGVYIFSLTSQGCVRPERVQHPTQKPVELISWCIERCKAKLVVYDPFLGSGTTMVACQQLGRKCRGIELHPPYCAVTLERLSQMGLEPRLAQ